MKFLRGKPEQLSGKAVIFLDLREPGGEPELHEGLSILAVLCAVTEMDLMELIIQVMHLPREHSRLITRFYKRYFQEIENIKRSFPGRISRIIDEVVEQEQQEVSGPTLESFREMFSRQMRAEDREEGEPGAENPAQLPQPDFYSTMIPLPSREFIALYTTTTAAGDFKFDIIDLERHEQLEVGHLVLDAHSRLYVADYLNQQERQIDLPEQRQYRSPYRNFREIERGEFKRLLGELSSELMYLIETGGSTERVFADLKQLTGGSYLMREVVSMYEISTTLDPNRVRLMELYFRKIFSLIDEDYLKTKEIEEEIQRYSV